MKSILILEDDILLGKMYKKKLEESGYQVNLQYTARGALTVLKTDGIDLLLLDIMLGGDMNGFDVLEEIKKDQKLAPTKVVVLTNLDDQEKIAMEIGADAIYSKTSVKPAEIVEKISQLVGN